MALSKKAQETIDELFQKDPGSMQPNDPELVEILQNEVFGEMASCGPLNNQEREMITIAVLTSISALEQLKNHIKAAMHTGVSAVEIRETIYQCAPYVGFPKVFNALHTANEVFKEAGCSLPLENAGTVAYKEREEKGAAIQLPLYGDEVKQVFVSLPGEYGTLVPHLLTSVGFGDFATRGVLNAKQKEMIYLIALVSINASTQVKPHLAGAVKAGNTLEEITAAIVQALPYIGFPYALSALIQVTQYDENKKAEAYR